MDNGRSVLKSEMLYRIHNPVSNTETSWDSTAKEAKVIHWPTNAPTWGAANSLSAFMATVPGTVVEKLGLRNIQGVGAEGTRSTYAIGAQDKNGQALTVIHESWYCPELKITVLETNDDPRSGTTRNELVAIIRGEPDVAKYKPPADYAVQDMRPPVQ